MEVLPILRTTTGLFLIDFYYHYDDVFDFSKIRTFGSLKLRDTFKLSEGYQLKTSVFLISEY